MDPYQDLQLKYGGREGSKDWTFNASVVSAIFLYGRVFVDRMEFENKVLLSKLQLQKSPFTNKITWFSFCPLAKLIRKNDSQWIFNV